MSVNLSEQMNGWAEMQKQAWSEWTKMLTSVPGMPGFAAAGDPAAAMKEGVENLTKGGNEAAHALMDRMMGSQGAMNRVMEFFLKSWKVVSPNVEAGKDWRPDLQKFAADWAKDATANMQKTLGMGSSFSDLASSTVKDWPGALGPWFGFLQQMTSMDQLSDASLGGPAGLAKLLAMQSEMHPLQGIGELPRFGVSREKNAKFMRMFDAGVELRRNSLSFHTQFAQGLAKAVEATVEQLGALAQKGEKISTVRDLMRLWYRTADGSLMHTFNSPEFIAAQNAFSQAGLTFKIRQRAVLEDFLASLDMPTRSELNDAYKVIHELKREVRALKKGPEAVQKGTKRAGARAGSTDG
jgi:class III poly(R)-hydroxyalkanoic acid synthase PhaE subunit